MFSSVTQSCQTLCDPMDFSTPGFPATAAVAAAESRQSCPTLCDPIWQATRLPSLGFSRQEYWSGLPFPSSIYHQLPELTQTHVH